MTESFNSQNNKLDKNKISKKKILVLLSVIIVSSFLIRIYFINFEIHLTNDALNYFFYALDIKINNQLPINYSLSNPGWGIFLSIFFSNFESQNVIDYMNLQRILVSALFGYSNCIPFGIQRKCGGIEASAINPIAISKPLAIAIMWTVPIWFCTRLRFLINISQVLGSSKLTSGDIVAK